MERKEGRNEIEEIMEKEDQGRQNPVEGVRGGEKKERKGNETSRKSGLVLIIIMIS